MNDLAGGVTPQHQPVRQVLVPVILLDELVRAQREHELATGGSPSTERTQSEEYRVAVALERAIRSYERAASKLSSTNEEEAQR